MERETESFCIITIGDERPTVYAHKYGVTVRSGCPTKAELNFISPYHLKEWADQLVLECDAVCKEKEDV